MKATPREEQFSIDDYLQEVVISRGNQHGEDTPQIVDVRSQQDFEHSPTIEVLCQLALLNIGH